MGRASAKTAETVTSEAGIVKRLAPSSATGTPFVSTTDRETSP